MPVGNEGFSAGAVSFTSLAFSEDGTPFISFRDNVNSAKATVMKYSPDDGEWERVGNAGFSAGLVNNTMLAIDDGVPFVAYKDSLHGQGLTMMRFAEASTVTYDSSGASVGSVPIDSNVYDNQASVTVSGNTGNLEKLGYVFAGWNTSADGNGTNYLPGDTFTIRNASVKLYAKWTTPSVTVSYLPGEHGMLSGMAQETVSNGGSPSAVPAVTPHTGYRFTGWSSDGGTTKLSSEELSLTIINTSIMYTAFYAPEIIKGDADGDGRVTAADALLLTRYLKGKITLTPEQQDALDMNGDGVLDELDVQMILQAYTGKG